MSRSMSRRAELSPAGVFPRRISLLSLLLMLSLLSVACGAGGNPGVQGEKGGIALSVQWENPPAARGSQLTMSRSPSVRALPTDVCTDFGVVTVTMYVLDNASQVVGSGAYLCQDHAGRIQGIPVGTGYRVRLDGTVSGNLLRWQGIVNNVTVAKDQVTSLAATMLYVGNDTTPPAVSSVTPSDNATNVPTNVQVSVVFSEPVVVSTIDNVAITLRAGSTYISGTVQYNSGSRTATFTPSGALAFGTQYTLTVDNTVTDLAGLRSPAPVTSRFTTGASADINPPQIMSVSPADNATGVSTNALVSAGFSEALDPGTVNTSSISLKTGVNSVAGSVLYNSSTFTATFYPSLTLSSSTTYVFRVDNTVTDIVGNPLAAAHVTSFTTAAAPDTTPPSVVSMNPPGGATGVSLSTTVTAMFSEAMDRTTVTSSTFTIAAGASPVSGSISWVDNSAIFTPTGSLGYATNYTCTVKGGAGGVKDVAGNPMTSDRVWTFRTGSDTTPPTVPVLLSVDTVSSTRIDLAWNASTDNAGVAGYRVYRDGTQVGTSVPTSYVGAWLNPNTLYCYTVSAYDGSGNESGQSASMCATTNNYWAKTFGGTGYDLGVSALQTTDNGFIVVGRTNSIGAGSHDIYLIKTDAGGNAVWTKTFGGSGEDRSKMIQQTSDGGYIIVGTSSSFGTGDNNVYLIKTDSAGNQTWSKTFGGAGADGGFSVQQTSDGGYIVSAVTNSFGAGLDDVYLIKTDSNGNAAWTRTFGGTSWDYGYEVQQTSDGGFIIGGWTWPTASQTDVLLIKADFNGNAVWTRTFGGTGYDEGTSVKQTSDGGYIIAAYTTSYGTGGDIWLIKTDGNGNATWTKTFGGTGFELPYSVLQTSDGGYVIAGQTNSYGAGNYDGYLIKTDSNGNGVWTRTFGGVNIEQFYSVRQTSDGGYIIAGRTESFGSGDSDVYLIKTDSNGNVQ